MTSSPFLALCVLWCAPGGEAPPNKDFTLRAEVVEALEGGPLVIKATLCYRGPEATEIYWMNWGPNARLKVPRAWKYCEPERLVFGRADGEQRLSPGEDKTEILRIHNMYSGIGSGKTSVTVTWDVYTPGEKRELISKLSVPLEIDIPPATHERLAALRKHMEEQIQRPDLPDEQRRRLVDDIIDTRHHALAPVAWLMIEAPGPFDLTGDLIEFVSECPEDARDVDDRLAKLAANPDWRGLRDAFNYWRNRKTDVPPAAWRTLTEADSVWTRALTYVTFPMRCGKEWKQALLHDLRDQSKPLPTAPFDRLLADLDDDTFDVREKASARLARLGERVEGQLRLALGHPLSAETRQRVTAVLDKMREAKQPPDCARALDYFWAFDAPENGELLQVLAEGQADTWLTQQAKGKLAEWRKDRGLPDK